jgi:hypothetical protein
MIRNVKAFSPISVISLVMRKGRLDCFIDENKTFLSYETLEPFT